MPHWHSALLRWAALLLTGMLLPATRLHAQRATLDSLRSARTYVRLTDRDTVVFGRIERLEGDSIWLRFRGSPVSVRRLEKIAARTYHPDPLGNGAVLGAGIGVFAGTVFGHVCIGCEIQAGDATLIWGGLFTGAILGLLVDLGRERAEWTHLWSRPQ